MAVSYTHLALWESLKEIAGDSPLIFMGHGTEHSADESYMIIEQALRAYARHPVYIATVEGKRTIQDVIRQMKDEGIVNTRVVLAPFMLVAGDHANNDMAGESDSFASILKEEGYAPECVLKGIGEYPAMCIRDSICGCINLCTIAGVGVDYYVFSGFVQLVR